MLPSAQRLCERRQDLDRYVGIAVHTSMRRFARAWAVAGSFLMLCLLAGVSDWVKDSEKALRNQRSRSARTTRLDADHDAYDHSGELLSGSHAASLSRQLDPRWDAPAVTVAATPAALPAFGSWEPLFSIEPAAPISFRGSLTAGRAPPSVLL